MSLLEPAPDELLELVPVSPLVNNANNEGAELLDHTRRKGANEPAAYAFRLVGRLRLPRHPLSAVPPPMPDAAISTGRKDIEPVTPQLDAVGWPLSSPPSDSHACQFEPSQ